MRADLKSINQSTFIHIFGREGQIWVNLTPFFQILFQRAILVWGNKNQGRTWPNKMVKIGDFFYALHAHLMRIGKSDTWRSQLPIPMQPWKKWNILIQISIFDLNCSFIAFKIFVLNYLLIV